MVNSHSLTNKPIPHFSSSLFFLSHYLSLPSSLSLTNMSIRQFYGLKEGIVDLNSVTFTQIEPSTIGFVLVIVYSNHVTQRLRYDNKREVEEQQTLLLTALQAYHGKIKQDNAARQVIEARAEIMKKMDPNVLGKMSQASIMRQLFEGIPCDEKTAAEMERVYKLLEK